MISRGRIGGPVNLLLLMLIVIELLLMRRRIYPICQHRRHEAFASLPLDHPIVSPPNA
jgi:hypothetical protein